MITEELAIPPSTIVVANAAAAEVGDVGTAASKSYLRRLGEYLHRRRIRTASGGQAVEEDPDTEMGDAEQQLEGDIGDLPNVIYSDSVEDKVMQKQGNYVICDEPAKKSSSTSSFVSSSTSDISDVEVEGIVNNQKKKEERMKALEASSNGYLLPRVFLNKEG